VTFTPVDDVNFVWSNAEFPLSAEICSSDILCLRLGAGKAAAPYLPKRERRPACKAATAGSPRVSIETGGLVLRSLVGGAGLAFCDCAGRERLRLKISDVDLHPRLRLRFEVVGEQHFYGLGHGGQPFDRLGAVRQFSNRHVNHGPGCDIAIPLLLSNCGYGLFFDEASPALIDPGRSYDAICLDYECDAQSLALYFLGGTTMRATLGSVCRLFGRAPMPPRWALGFLQSTRHFADRAEVLQTADMLREKRLPCDALIFLSSYGKALGWNIGVGHLAYQPKLFHEPSTLIAALHERGFHVVTHEYPVLHARSELYAEARRENYLLDEGYGDRSSGSTDYHERQRYLDFSRPEVGSWWWGKHGDLVKDGIDGWWLDGGEGPNLTANTSAEAVALHNRYDLLRQQAFALGEAQDRPNKRPFLLCRSGGPGMQRFGAACWSGDINNTFAALEAQPSLGLNVGLSGVPYWGTDIGGYYAVVPQTAELFVRWLQFGCFCPIFRAHGRNWRMHVPWAYGADVEAMCRRILELRYQLLPYTYTLAFAAHLDGLPLMRPLVLNYRSDPNVWGMSAEFLWGDDILVAPVTRAGARHWPVYFPKGTWYDFWTSNVFEGPAAIEVDAPLERLPLFVRAGAILPLGVIVQHAEPGAPKELTLVVYPEKESSFTLYDDDGASNAYLAGGYARTKFTCVTNPRETIFRIEAPQGSASIVPPDRLYRIRIYSRERPREVEITTADEGVSQPKWHYESKFVTVMISRSPAEVIIHV
jgi:alpha-glucosidase (family GH31 glycosyl hydrolase)